jgi:hypothetical protein
LKLMDHQEHGRSDDDDDDVYDGASLHPRH